MKTFTEDWLAVTRSPPHVYGNVALDNGANVFAEFADTPAGTIEVGTPVRFVFRIKDFDAVRALPPLFLEGRAGEDLTMATGIRDKVAIIGMGCSRFGERWDCGPTT